MLLVCTAVPPAQVGREATATVCDHVMHNALPIPRVKLPDLFEPCPATDITCAAPAVPAVLVG